MTTQSPLPANGTPPTGRQEASTSIIRSARLVLGCGLPVALAVLGLAPYLVVRGDLPSRLATHFNEGGVPDGSMSHAALLISTGLMFAAGLVCTAVVAARRKPMSSFTGLGVAALGGFLMGLGAGILAQTAITQRSIASWTDASVSWPGVVGSIILGLVGSAVAARAASLLPYLQISQPLGSSPVMELGDDEHAVWSGTLRSPVLIWVGIASLLVMIRLAFATNGWLMTGIGVVAGGAILAISSIRVTADATGLRVAYGRLPWPSTHIPADQIASATAIEVDPKQWGGWGYRGSLRIMKQAAVVLRRGPGVRLDLTNGKVFVVTIDNPETPVALLNGVRARGSVAADG